MRHQRVTRLLSALLMCVAGLASAADSSKPASPDGVAAEVEARERKLIAAIGSRNLEAYSRLVADDYVAIRPTGDLTKEQVLNDYRTAVLAYRGLDIRDVTVRVFGDSAVLTARTEGTRIEKGVESPNRVRYLRVWARRGGVWLAVLQMAVPIPPE